MKEETLREVTNTGFVPPMYRQEKSKYEVRFGDELKEECNLNAHPQLCVTMNVLKCNIMSLYIDQHFIV